MFVVYKNVLLVIITFLCMISLSSCNLKPIYIDKPDGINAELAAIELEPIDTIDGAEFYYAFSNLLPKSNIMKTKYLLKVKLVNGNFLSVIDKNSDISREIMSQIIYYQLINIENNQEITSGSLKHMTSYTITSTPYSSYITNEKTMEDLSKQAATELLERLILYFTNQLKVDRTKNEVVSITN